MDNNFVVSAVLMNLFKNFDSLSHDVLIAKLDVWEFDEKTFLMFIGNNV